MMTTAAEKVAVPGVKKKEKVEKRRALGRGLESLLPGPRVVTAAPGQNSGTAGKQQVPHFVRNEKPLEGMAVTAAAALADGPLVIQAVVEGAEAPAAHTPTTHASGVEEAESITIFAQAESRMPANL